VSGMSYLMFYHGVARRAGLLLVHPIAPVIRGYFGLLTSRVPPISHLELKAQLG
jgi:hypothetical protein